LTLTGPLFEPLSNLDKVSLKHLTLKTVFLTLLASGSRRGEVHAFSFEKFAHPPLWEYPVSSQNPHLWASIRAGADSCPFHGALERDNSIQFSIQFVYSINSI
jgi:hypothetical protein